MTSDGHSCHIYVSSFTIAKACSVTQSQLSDIFSSDRSLRKANVRFFICTFVRPIQTCRELCHHFSQQSLSSLSAVSQQSLSSLSKQSSSNHQDDIQIFTFRIILRIPLKITFKAVNFKGYPRRTLKGTLKELQVGL